MEHAISSVCHHCWELSNSYISTILICVYAMFCFRVISTISMFPLCWFSHWAIVLLYPQFVPNCHVWKHWMCKHSLLFSFSNVSNTCNKWFLQCYFLCWCINSFFYANVSTMSQFPLHQCFHYTKVLTTSVPAGFFCDLFFQE